MSSLNNTTGPSFPKNIDKIISKIVFELALEKAGVNVKSKPDPVPQQSQADILKDEIKIEESELKYLQTEQETKVESSPLGCEDLGEDHNFLSFDEKQLCLKEGYVKLERLPLEFLNPEEKSKITDRCFVKLTRLTPEQKKRYFFKHGKASSNKPCDCNICFKRFTNKGSLANHMRFVHSVDLFRKYRPEAMECLSRKCIIKLTRIPASEMEPYLKKCSIENEEDCVGYKCYLCQEEFSTKLVLVDHVRYHFGFDCSLCKKTFPVMAHYKDHMESYHENRCPLCSRTLKDIHRLKSHMLLHSDNLKQVCLLCSKRFRQGSHLKEHLQTHTNEKHKKCHFCPSSVDKHRLEKHLSKNPDVVCIFQCLHCDTKFTSWLLLQNHVNTHRREGKKCNLCSKTFKAPSALKQHLLFHLNLRNFLCHVCGKTFHEESALKKHLGTHNDTKSFHCAHCKKQFKTREALVAHLKSHKNSSYCSICDIALSSPSALKSHALIHANVKPYSCSMCTKSFRSTTAFSLHMKMHRGEKPYSCNLCEAKFYQKVALDRHLKIHAGEDLFKCRGCNQTFKHKAALKEHLLEHPDLLQHLCEICGQFFYTRGHLLFHLKKH